MSAHRVANAPSVAKVVSAATVATVDPAATIAETAARVSPANLVPTRNNIPKCHNAKGATLQDRAFVISIHFTLSSVIVLKHPVQTANLVRIKTP